MVVTFNFKKEVIKYTQVDKILHEQYDIVPFDIFNTLQVVCFFCCFFINTLIDRADCWASFVAEDAYSLAVTAPVPKFKNGKS